MGDAPSWREIELAREVVAARHPRTLLHRYVGLSSSPHQVFAKHEHHSPIRSFKGRGAFFAVSRLASGPGRRGVVTASTGNHGQGVAWAARVFGMPTTVVTPVSTPEVKKRAMRSQGAELVEVDGNLAEATDAARVRAEELGLAFMEDGEDPGLMAGAASMAWEILEELPEPDLLVVPVGGGNLIAALSMVVKVQSPGTRIIGVQSEAAPAVHDSFLAGRVEEAPCETMAGGLATSHPGALALSVILENVDEICLVSEAEVADSVVHTLEVTGQLLEPAGAASTAALRRYGEDWEAGDAVLIFSGGNIAIEQVRDLLTEREAPALPGERSTDREGLSNDG